MSYIYKLAPRFFASFIGSNVAAPIIGYFVGVVLEIAVRETEMGLFFLYIDLRTSAQGRDFEKQARSNFEVQKNGTPEEKAAAEKELIDSFRAFVKISN